MSSATQLRWDANLEQYYDPQKPYNPIVYQTPSEGETALQDLFGKRLIVLCDGTGQAADKGHSDVPTNVTRFGRALRTSEKGAKPDGTKYEIPQIVLYQSGVGTDATTYLSNTVASAFGRGVDENILDAYTFFSNNFEQGDTLYIFGFSRGAFTARALASLICNAGLLAKESIHYLPLIYSKYKDRLGSDEGKRAWTEFFETRSSEFQINRNVVINILGIWDTVGSIGVPQTWLSTGAKQIGLDPDLNSRYGYHDVSFPVATAHKGCKAHISKAIQALSLDECRTSFTPTLLFCRKEDALHPLLGHETQFQQCWFAGSHSDVGGGYERAFGDISDIAFAWMVDMCNGSLTFVDFQVLVDELRKPSVKGLDPANILAGRTVEQKPWALSTEHDEFHTPTFVLAGSLIRTPGQYFLKMPETYLTHESIHASVRRRLMAGEWKPESLAGFVLKKDGPSGWYWEKKVDVEGKRQTIRLGEWGVDGPRSMSGLLLGEEDRKALGDEAASLAIRTPAVKGPIESVAAGVGDVVTSPVKVIGNTLSGLSR